MYSKPGLKRSFKDFLIYKNKSESKIYIVALVAIVVTLNIFDEFLVSLLCNFSLFLYCICKRDNFKGAIEKIL